MTDDSPARGGWPAAVAEGLLPLFPRDFRRAYGRRIVELVAERARAARRRGFGCGLRVSLRLVLDTLATALRLRLAALRDVLLVGRRASEPESPRPASFPDGPLPTPSPSNRHRKKEWSPDMLMHDLRFALRTLRGRPLLTAVVVLTLSLGIATNAVIYSLVDAVVFHPFDFPEPDRVVAVGSQFPRLGGELTFFEHLSAQEYADIREQVGSLERTVAFDLGNRQLSGGDRPENLFTGFWWGDALSVFGLEPAAGRGFSREEIEEGRSVALISHRIWQSRFGGDPSLVGETIRINGEPYTLIGVIPEGLLIYGTDLWMPMWASPDELPRNRRQFQVAARIAPGATLEEVDAELATLADRTWQRYGAEFEEYEGWRLEASTWADVVVGAFELPSMILLGAVGLVLLLICANVASLLLARSAGRRREIALRAALGAGRGRLVRQLLTESVVLAVGGGLLGVAFAYAGLELLVSRLLTLGIPGLPIDLGTDVTMNVRVLGFTAGLSVLSGVAFGLVPALQSSRFDLQRALNLEAAQTTGSRGRRRWNGVFVAVEVALALTLLVGAGLLGHSFVRLQAVDPGVRVDHVLTMRLTLPWERYEGEAIPNFFLRLQERVEAIPGVRSAGIASQFPSMVFGRSQLTLPDTMTASEGELPTSFLTIVSRGYFETLEVPLVLGRLFEDGDRADTPLVAVVNREFVRRYFPEGEALGERFKLGPPEDDERPWLEIVGIVGDTRNRGLATPPAPEFFVGMRQGGRFNNQQFLLLHTGVPPRSVLPAVREVVADMDPEQPVYAIRTLEEAYAQEFAIERFAMTTLGAFALLALLLAAVGIYGVVSYAVSQRTREIGVRIALGADQGVVKRLMVRQALVPVAAGLVVGLGLAALVGSAMESLLFEVGGLDPLTIGGVAAFLAGVALLASWLPARRASAVDPVTALRAE